MYTGCGESEAFIHNPKRNVSKRCEELIAMISDLVRNVETRYFLLEASKKFVLGVMFEGGAGL